MVTTRGARREPPCTDCARKLVGFRRKPRVKYSLISHASDEGRFAGGEVWQGASTRGFSLSRIDELFLLGYPPGSNCFPTRF